MADIRRKIISLVLCLVLMTTCLPQTGWSEPTGTAAPEELSAARETTEPEETTDSVRSTDPADSPDPSRTVESADSTDPGEAVSAEESTAAEGSDGNETSGDIAGQESDTPAGEGDTIAVEPASEEAEELLTEEALLAEEDLEAATAVPELPTLEELNFQAVTTQISFDYCDAAAVVSRSADLKVRGNTLSSYYPTDPWEFLTEEGTRDPELEEPFWNSLPEYLRNVGYIEGVWIDLSTGGFADTSKTDFYVDSRKSQYFKGPWKPGSYQFELHWKQRLADEWTTVITIPCTIRPLTGRFSPVEASGYENNAYVSIRNWMKYVIVAEVEGQYYVMGDNTTIDAGGNAAAIPVTADVYGNISVGGTDAFITIPNQQASGAPQGRTYVDSKNVTRRLWNFGWGAYGITTDTSYQTIGGIAVSESGVSFWNGSLANGDNDLGLLLEFYGDTPSEITGLYAPRSVNKEYTLIPREVGGRQVFSAVPITQAKDLANGRLHLYWQQERTLLHSYDYWDRLDKVYDGAPIFFDYQTQLMVDGLEDNWEATADVLTQVEWYAYGGKEGEYLLDSAPCEVGDYVFVLWESADGGETWHEGVRVYAGIRDGYDFAFDGDLTKDYDGDPVWVDPYKQIIINKGALGWSDIEKSVNIGPEWLDAKGSSLENCWGWEGPSEPGEYYFCLRDWSDKGKEPLYVLMVPFSIIYNVPEPTYTFVYPDDMEIPFGSTEGELGQMYVKNVECMESVIVTCTIPTALKSAEGYTFPWHVYRSSNGTDYEFSDTSLCLYDKRYGSSAAISLRYRIRENDWRYAVSGEYHGKITFEVTGATQGGDDND